MGQLPTLPLQRPDFAAAVIFLTLGCSIGALFLQSYAISSLGSNRYSTFIGVSTVPALASGAVFLGARLSVLQWLGGAAVPLGIYLSYRRSAAEV